MKDVRAVKIVSTEGGAAYDNIVATFQGDNGFRCELRFRTNESMPISVELGREYRLSITEIAPETGKEVQPAPSAG